MPSGKVVGTDSCDGTGRACPRCPGTCDTGIGYYCCLEGDAGYTSHCHKVSLLHFATVQTSFCRCLPEWDSLKRCGLLSALNLRLFVPFVRGSINIYSCRPSAFKLKVFCCIIFHYNVHTPRVEYLKCHSRLAR